VPGDGGARAVVDVVLQRPTADVESAHPADVRQDDDDVDDPRSDPARHGRLHLPGDQHARRGYDQNLPSSPPYVCLGRLQHSLKPFNGHRYL